MKSKLSFLKIFLASVVFVMASCADEAINGVQATAGPGSTVLIYGATGVMGSAFVEEGLLRGYEVIGVSRNPSRFNAIRWPGFTGVKGDITDINSVRELIKDVDYVIVSVMASTPEIYNEVARGDIKTPTPEESVQNVGARNLISVSREMGDDAPRIIQVNGGSTIYYNGKQLFEYMPPGVAPAIGTEGYSVMWGHHVVLDTYAEAPDVKWTVATAAPGIEFGVRGERTQRPIWTGPGEIELPAADLELEFTGKFIDAVRHLSGTFSTVDFGRAIFDEIDNSQYIGKRFTVMYADR